MTQQFHKNYLKFTALVIGSFAPIFFLGTMPPTSSMASWTIDMLASPLDGQQNYEAPGTRFLSALTGGFLFGWAVCVWCLQRWVYDEAPEGVRKSVLYSLLAWCMLDSAGSIASGNAMNAVYNLAVLIVGVGPLWRPAKK